MLSVTTMPYLNELAAYSLAWGEYSAGNKLLQISRVNYCPGTSEWLYVITGFPTARTAGFW